MKKILVLGAFLLTSFVGIAQNVENFEVGPYEVDYKGLGNYKYRLRKGIDLYEYYGLKRDTLVQTHAAEAVPITGAFQLCASMSMPRYVANGTSNVFGIDGGWKQQISERMYFNAGLSLAMSFGKYGVVDGAYTNWEDGGSSETMFEFGVPLSLEWCNLDRERVSLYVGVGIVPTFYSGAEDKDGDSKSGLLIAPRLDIGGYIPVGQQLIRLGAFTQYDINCSGGDYDAFKERIGRLFIGANIGLVF